VLRAGRAAGTVLSPEAACLPRPYGRGPSGLGAAARFAAPATAAGRFPPSRPRPVNTLARQARSILLAPGILAPGKITIKGTPSARRYAMALAPPLTLIFSGKTSTSIRRMGEHSRRHS
jgi:hypothetical protein